MNIITSRESNLPLYEQIKNQIINNIIKKNLKPQEKLPSIRVLAKGLQVGVITVKRAYDDLVNDGYLSSHEGKGYFVEDIKLNKIKQYATSELKKELKQIKQIADNYKLEYEVVSEILKEIYNE